MIKHLCICLWLLGLFYVFFNSISKIKRLDTLAQVGEQEDISSETLITHLPPRLVDVFTLGHRAVFDDVLQILAVHTLSPEKNNVHARITMAKILQFKPKVESIYLLACYHFLFKEKKPEQCLQTLQAGLEVFPRSWRLPMTQGYVHAFVLKENTQAGAFYAVAAAQPSAPSWISELAAKLLAESELTPEVALKTLQSLFEQNQETQTIFKQIVAPIFYKQIARSGN